MVVMEEFTLKPKHTIVVREVWAHNLESEFAIIRGLVHQFPYVSMDTEFPGVIFKPNNFRPNNMDPTNIPRRHDLSPSDQYKVMKSNVDTLNLIQLGLTLSDGHGNLPVGTRQQFIWQFNFQDFDVECDPHAPDSIDLLKQHGIDFERNRIHGVRSARFAWLMITSGLLFNDSVSWITFHGYYDFGYLLKIITRRTLPVRLEDFLESLSSFIGTKVYDVKYLMKFCNNSLYGGLDRVAKTLKVERAVGKCHQAGSDSLLTWHVFLRMRDVYFVKDGLDKYAGVLFGLELFYDRTKQSFTQKRTHLLRCLARKIPLVLIQTWTTPLVLVPNYNISYVKFD